MIWFRYTDKLYIKKLGITFSPQNYHHHQQFLSKLKENKVNKKVNIDNQCCLRIPKGWNVALCHLSEENTLYYMKITFCYFSCSGWYCFRPTSMAALSSSPFARCSKLLNKTTVQKGIYQLNKQESMAFIPIRFINKKAGCSKNILLLFSIDQNHCTETYLFWWKKSLT